MFKIMRNRKRGKYKKMSRIIKFSGRGTCDNVSLLKNPLFKRKKYTNICAEYVLGVKTN